MRLDLDVIDDPNAVEGYEEDEFHPPCKSAGDVDVKYQDTFVDVLFEDTLVDSESDARGKVEAHQDRGVDVLSTVTYDDDVHYTTSMHCRCCNGSVHSSMDCGCIPEFNGVQSRNSVKSGVGVVDVKSEDFVDNLHSDDDLESTGVLDSQILSLVSRISERSQSVTLTTSDST